MYNELRKAVEARGVVFNAQEFWEAQHLLHKDHHVMLTEELCGTKLMSDHVSRTGLSLIDVSLI